MIFNLEKACIPSHTNPSVFRLPALTPYFSDYLPNFFPSLLS